MREGGALLHGLARCCGRRLRTHYRGRLSSPGYHYPGKIIVDALSEAERSRIIEVSNEPRFADTPPAQIVPTLADEGIYIASEASFRRVLRAHGQMTRRGRAQPP